MLTFGGSFSFESLGDILLILSLSLLGGVFDSSSFGGFTGGDEMDFFIFYGSDDCAAFFLASKPTNVVFALISALPFAPIPASSGSAFLAPAKIS